MEEAQEKDMDSTIGFKSGQSLTITGRQYHVCSQGQMINLLVSSNRYGYVLYATETDGLAIIPSTLIDRESRYLNKSSEEDDEENKNENLDKTSIIHRSYIPGQTMNKNPTIVPYWISLNSDETILALVLSQLDTHSWLIILYDLVQFIQIPNSIPFCPPTRLSSDAIGGTIQYFTWNPMVPNTFAYIDGHGLVSSFEIDFNSKQLKSLGQSDANDDNSSICWSPKGKQIVVVKCNGALDLYEPNMKLKKSYPSMMIDPSCPPCISVLWLTNYQFLLGFSENNPDDNANDNSFFHILVTYDKDQRPKSQIYNDLFFDADGAAVNINPQFFYARLNDSKILISGLSKSLKINVLGRDELNQDSLNIWTLADQFRATVKGPTNVNNQRPILTGMALGLNSTLSISEGNTKLPSCPILLLSNSEGLLQVYYFFQQNLPSMYQTPVVIKPIQAPPLTPVEPFFPSGSTKNGFSFTNVESTLTTITPSKVGTTPNTFPSSQQPIKPPIDDLFKAMATTVVNKTILVPQIPIKTNEKSTSSIPNNKNLLPMIEEFQTKLNSVKKPLTNLPESSINLDQSLESLITTLNDMTIKLQTSEQSINSLTHEHIKSMAKIENAYHQITSSQKENLYYSLKDRELDPWTQSRLDSIETKYNQLKKNFNVLLQLTHTNIHDKSLPTDGEDADNEDFLPDLEISLNTNETMKQRMYKRVLQLSHQVAETEKDLESICTKFNKTSLSSSTFTKTTMSSNRSFHTSDAQILSHLQTTHPTVLQIRVPPPTVINLSSPIEQNKQSTIEITKPVIPPVLPLTPKQTNSPTVESESFKNMLRLVRTSIDLFSGVASPEQLQELSSTIATSPLSSTQKSNVASISKTPTISKTTNPSKTSTTTKPSTTTNILQTPAKSVTSPVPTISVTPATPANTLDAAFKVQSNKPIIQTPTDLSKAQTISLSGDSAIRSLLNNTVSPPTTIASIPNQPIITSTPNQVIKPTIFGGAPSTSTPQMISQSTLPTPTTTVVMTPVISTPSSIQSPFNAPLSPASTVTTSVQSISPTKPIMSTGFSSFGSKPTFPGSGFNLTPNTSSSMPFGGTATTASTGSFFGGTATSTAPTSAPFGGGFGTSTTTTAATTSTPSSGLFGLGTSSVPIPFGSGFGTPATATATTSSSTTGVFGATTTTTSSPFGSGFGSATTPATTSASSTGAFGGGFGSNTTATSPFGGSFNTSSPTSPGTVFAGFGAPASLAPTSTTGTSIFGSSGFGFSSASPATSPATSTASSSLFGSGGGGGGGGGGTSTFGSGFSGFNTQSNLSALAPAFSFSGFGSQPSDTSTTQPSFGPFGSPPAATQAPSPFGGSLFGGAAGQSPGFGTATSSFGASSTQTAGSPSFTTYRK